MYLLLLPFRLMLFVLRLMRRLLLHLFKPKFQQRQKKQSSLRNCAPPMPKKPLLRFVSFLIRTSLWSVLIVIVFFLLAVALTVGVKLIQRPMGSSVSKVSISSHVK